MQAGGVDGLTRGRERRWTGGGPVQEWAELERFMQLERKG